MAKTKEERKLMLQAMQRVTEGDYSELSEEAFEDKEFVEVFNRMVGHIALKNTHYLMRINDSMRTIGNSSWIKKIFDLITEQQKTLEKLQETNLLYSDSIEKMDDTGVNAMSIIRQIHNSIVPCIDSINEIIIELEGIRGAALSSEGTAEKIRRLMAFNSRNMLALVDQSDAAVKHIQSIYSKYSESAELSKPLMDAIAELVDSCTKMSIECFSAGKNMYEISRGVDEARNDMFRHNSKPSLHDSMEVFATDHLVVTWRMYNHIQEYETLRRAQVDNPDRCKLGLWLRNGAPEWLRETQSYKDVFDAHELLHKHLIDCFDAREKYQTDAMWTAFECALSQLDVLLSCIDEVHATLREHGDFLETSHIESDII